MMKQSLLALRVLVCVAACAPEPELAVGQTVLERSSVTPTFDGACGPDLTEGAEGGDGGWGDDGGGGGCTSGC
ncbi:MAG: hypothetical protein ACE37F_01500 [Nannocystaceae bacterium]|nr:hypothetical protein [bacterium]